MGKKTKNLGVSQMRGNAASYWSLFATTTDQRMDGADTKRVNPLEVLASSIPSYLSFVPLGFLITLRLQHKNFRAKAFETSGK